MDHAEIDRFFMMTDDEKFLYAYWAQRRNSHNAGRIGFILGAGAGLFVALVVAGLAFS